MPKLVYFLVVLQVLLCSCTIAPKKLKDIPFWQVNEGVWASENTYLAPGYDHRIKLYHSIIEINLQNDLVTMRESKFYPPGKFNAAYLGLDISPDYGVEFVQTTRGKLRENSLVVEVLPEETIQADTSKSMGVTTVIRAVSESTALMTVRQPSDSTIDSYRIFISLPTETYRYANSVGINNESTSAQAGALRGMAFSAAKRIAPEAMAEEREKMSLAHSVRYRVLKIDGEFVVEELN